MGLRYCLGMFAVSYYCAGSNLLRGCEKVANDLGSSSVSSSTLVFSSTYNWHEYSRKIGDKMKFLNPLQLQSYL